MAKLIDGQLKGYHGIPPPLSEYRALCDLDIFLSKLVHPAPGREFWFGIIPETSHVTSLAIVGCDLTTLPDILGDLRALTLLYLDHNRLTSLVRHSKVLAYS